MVHGNAVAGRSAAAAGLAAALVALPVAAMDLSLAWTGDFAAVAQGGLQQGAHHLGLIDAAAAGEFEWLDGRDGEWQLTVQHTYGGGFSQDWVGDLQTVSNADAEHGIRLLEAWVEAEVADGWRVGAGKYDFNSEFDVIESGTLFLSSSQGIGPDISQSGESGPSIFPHTAVGAHVHVQPVEAVALRAVVLDADSSDRNRGGPLAAFEYQHDLGPSRLILGAWAYGGRKAQLEDPSVERIGSYFGGGVVHSGGLLPGVDDSVGFAVGVARNGSDYRDAMRAQGIATDVAEYALEATWRIPLGEHFALQPDLQYVINPDTDPSIDDALVFILRVEASL